MPDALNDQLGELTGLFLFRIPEDIWWWSDDLFRLLGYEADTVMPSGGLLRDHVHPEDRSCLDDALDLGRRTGKPFSCVLRIQDKGGTEHQAVMVGDGRCDGDDVVSLRGFVVDVTQVVAGAAHRVAGQDIARARASQEDVDLARGVLMALYGVDADVALRILRRHSQHTNVKLRMLAQAVRQAAPTAPGDRQHDLHQRVSRALYPPDQG
ncbi:PAS and ANTAR domain-containing protein [Streptomyces sp. TP-A0356]|uniref:PAS and ANTAR domain-containing protein n=1 Tax=Streptomyces sp. TP-A0356 TaxID=1359208 RepID=UPI0006E41D11|nr:PAS and ANTAR domain-containing protein [Streptomyces sp. TP-A0356]